jgi:hypothetical protein
MHIILKRSRNLDIITVTKIYYYAMKFVEGTLNMRRLDQPSTHSHRSIESVDFHICSAPSDSEDDQVHQKITRKNTRKSVRLERFMYYFGVQYVAVPPIEGRTLLH